MLSILHEELKTKEESIESLQPIQDYFWEKNVTLREQMASAIEKISNLKKYKPHEVMQNLPQALSYIDQCLWTIAQYNTKNELSAELSNRKKSNRGSCSKRRRISPFKTFHLNPGRRRSTSSSSTTKDTESSRLTKITCCLQEKRKLETQRTGKSEAP